MGRGKRKGSHADVSRGGESRDSLSNACLAFHVAPSDSRDSILLHGIDTLQARWRPYAFPGDDPYDQANYLHLDRFSALNMAQSLTEMDVWAVDTEGLALHPDPQQSDCAYTDQDQPIAAIRLTLLTSTDEDGEWIDHVEQPEQWQPAPAHKSPPLRRALR